MAGRRLRDRLRDMDTIERRRGTTRPTDIGKPLTGIRVLDLSRLLPGP